jgi:SAM-dependent methyltransferase
MAAPTKVVVTVGMGRWPFDRLIDALDPLCERHEVFAQIGTATRTPACEHARFVDPVELRQRIASADVVVTHAGNTVRQVQRLGRVPIAVPRDPRFGEMGNDHQLRSLDPRHQRGPVVVGDLDHLIDQVDDHARTEPALLAESELLSPSDPAVVADRLRRLEPVAENPFERHPTRRYRFAFDQLARPSGRHLDLGSERGELLAALVDHTGLDAEGGEPMAEYRTDLASRRPDLTVTPVDPRAPLPFADRAFDSVSMLDVLEHTPDERRTLAEVHRVLRPGGSLVLTLPAWHAFTCLDPDNAKFKAPRLHRLAYQARFGRTAYQRRFVDTSDGMLGDLDAERGDHTNYRVEDLTALLDDAGFDVVLRDGANLFWRFFQVPSLFLPSRWQRIVDAPLRWDGRWFHQANLFVVAERREDDR